MADLSLDMGDINAFLELSPSYIYPDPDQGMDVSTCSESTSPMMSSFDGSPLSELYPSPEGSDCDSTSPQPVTEEERPLAPAPAPKPPAKRKRENRYKNAPPSVLSRRRAQNRASQRAYRERKDQRIKDLEAMLAEIKEKNDALSQAYAVLHGEYVKLQGIQVRSRQHAPRHSISVPYEHIGVGLHSPALAGGMFTYSDLGAYSV